MVGISEFSIMTFKEMSMCLSIKFENPLYISNGDTPDILSINIKDKTYFQSALSEKYIDISIAKYTLELTPQMP